MPDAEAADSRLEAVPDRERERHPRTDPENEQPARDPAHASESHTVAGAEVGGETAENAQRQADSGESNDQDEVVAGGRKGVQVLRADKEQQGERNYHAPAVELPLPSLTENEKDERSVEEILGSSHAAIIRGRPLHVVGAGVEPRVDLSLNPRVENTERTNRKRRLACASILLLEVKSLVTATS
jgi:hypothetical protein